MPYGQTDKSTRGSIDFMALTGYYRDDAFSVSESPVLHAAHASRRSFCHGGGRGVVLECATVGSTVVGTNTYGCGIYGVTDEGKVQGE